MARLAESDYRKALEVLYVAGEVNGRLAFPESVLLSLSDLVPCDVVAFHEGGASRNRVIVYVGEPIGELTTNIRAARRRLGHEDPMRPSDAARTLNDFVSMREFRRRDFYNLVHRPLGIEYMLQLYLDPGRTDARLEFDRCDRDFTQRDRTVLNRILPHLRQLLRLADRRPAGDVAALAPREHEVVEHVALGLTNGEIARSLGISPATVRKHLENIYEKLDVHTRTGAVAAVRGFARLG